MSRPLRLKEIRHDFRTSRKSLSSGPSITIRTVGDIFAALDGIGRHGNAGYQGRLYDSTLTSSHKFDNRACHFSHLIINYVQERIQCFLEIFYK